jgi:CDP-paratose 2-epimerase
MKVLITGSGGLIGSESVKFFNEKGFEVYGIDNDMRKYFFGEDASTNSVVDKLERNIPYYTHFNIDIRNKEKIEEIFRENKFDLIIHCAAQPSHDWAAKEPFTDFEINANGTLNLLENFRKHCPEAVFIFTSTNKVYGDTPNKLPLIERETRWEIDPNHKYVNGIDESMSIDQSKHSIFGASKVAADILVQEYGKYFNLKTASFRGGCLTGPAHKGAELHGFLAYLAKCIYKGKRYYIYGYKGKQVRDNIHSYDLVNAFYHFFKNPRVGEVYNMGGSRHSNISMLEAIKKLEERFGKKAIIEYIDKNRAGDHIWYISDVSKFKKHYPEWEYEYNIDAIIDDIANLYLEENNHNLY